MSGPRPALALFARDPRLEAASKPLVAGRSVPVHAALLADTVERLRRVAGDLVLVWQGEQEKAWTLRPRAVVPQRGRTFGERVAAALRDVASLGYVRVVLVGADCPPLGAAELSQALDDLERGDAVVIPASDGGINLLGLHIEHLAALDLAALPWETTALAEALRAALERGGLRVTLAAALADLDSPDELLRFLRGHPQTRLARLIQRAIGSALPLLPAPGRAARQPAVLFGPSSFLKNPPE